MNTNVATFNGMTGTAILSKGKVTGVSIMLGDMSAKELRDAGKTLGLKGSALTKYVNEALSNDGANRAARGAVAISALQSAGYVFDTAKARKGTASVSFVKPATVKAAEPTTEELCKKLGITVAQYEALKSVAPKA